jgi:hypothetical protein
MPSWYSVELVKHRDNFTFYFYNISVMVGTLIKKQGGWGTSK